MSNHVQAIYLLDNQEFTGVDRDYVEVPHSDDFALTEGTIAFKFSADDVSGRSGLFSKDATGYKDGGHLSVMIVDGYLQVRIQTTTESYYAKVKDPIVAGEEYHVAASFGEEGLQLFLNGERVVYKPDVTVGIETNEESFVVGALGWQRTEEKPEANYEFDGTISNFGIYDEQLNVNQVIELTDGALKEELLYKQALEDLMPAFAQLHHGTDFLKADAAKFGYGHEGEGMVMPLLMKDIQVGTDSNDNITGDGDDDFINAGMGDDTVNGGDGDDQIQGFYGNDDLFGGDGNDVLDGGHGEDYLNGGDGDDFLISQADGREGYVTYDPDRDETDPYNELDPATGKLYPEQPIPADDVLTGGAGADTFYFQTLINAKERFISKHNQSDGTIRWHGVAGENDNIHDHWVDVIGNDVITDFSKAEGDQIVIEGHTTEILNITHNDSNDDGVLDYSLIQLYSNQGNGGGAHADDLLGTITVFGDLVTESDIQSTAAPAYGIVKRIGDLEEAITPLTNGEERTFDPVIVDPVSVNGPEALFAMGGNEFSGEDNHYLEVAHNENMSLEKGTIAFNFRADDVSGTSGLFSKDAYGFKDGGHFSVMIIDGYLKVRVQSETENFWTKVHEPKIVGGEDYHTAISFGSEGLQIFLNGQLVKHKPEVTQGLETNEENIVIGALGWRRKEESSDADNEFDGSISNLGMYDYQLSEAEILSLMGSDIIGGDVVVDPVSEGPVVQDDVFNIDQGNQLVGFFHRDNGNGVDSHTEGDQLLYQSVNMRTENGGHVISDVNGWFRYTSATDFVGTDTFSYTVSDGNGGMDTATVTVNVGLDSVLIASATTESAEVLYGTDGEDVFTWSLDDVGSSVEEIVGFDVTEDVLNISDALGAYDPVTDAITDFVSITSDDGVNSTLKVDVNGGGDNFVEVAKISNVTGLDNEEQLLNDGTLVV